MKTVKVEPVFSQSTNLEVLDQNIRVSDQITQICLAFWRAEIDDDRLFSTVTTVKIRSTAFAVMVNKWRAPLARIIASWGLYLNHVSPKIGQRLTGPRASQNTRQFDNLAPSLAREVRFCAW